MGTRESIPAPLRLSLSGPAAVHEATSAARGFAESVGIDEVDGSRLAIVVEELVTNLFDHGGLNEDDMFEIELTITDTDIRVVLIDPGQAFDPRFVPDKDAIPSRGGGAGMKFLRAWAYHIDYGTTDGRNRLVVLLERDPRRA